jgi:DNA topoisomerase-1
MPRDTVDLQPVSPGLLYVNDDDPGLRRIKSGDGLRLSRLLTASESTTPATWTGSAPWPSRRPGPTSGSAPRRAATSRPPAATRRGRKQYRYHDAWRRDRDGAEVRPHDRLRPRPAEAAGPVESDLARRGLPRDKVVAAVVRLMELTLIRVGNEEYAKPTRASA